MKKPMTHKKFIKEVLKTCNNLLDGDHWLQFPIKYQQYSFEALNFFEPKKRLMFLLNYYSFETTTYEKRNMLDCGWVARYMPYGDDHCRTWLSMDQMNELLFSATMSNDHQLSQVSQIFLSGYKKLLVSVRKYAKKQKREADKIEKRFKEIGAWA